MTRLAAHFAAPECELAEFGVRVVVVSFGSVAAVTQYAVETPNPFTMLSDVKRELYGALGIGRSLSKVFSFATIAWYAETKIERGVLPSAFGDHPDDILQMGADFTFASDGRIVFEHRSAASTTDRPTVDMIAAACRDDTSASRTAAASAK